MCMSIPCLAPIVQALLSWGLGQIGVINPQLLLRFIIEELNKSIFLYSTVP